MTKIDSNPIPQVAKNAWLGLIFLENALFDTNNMGTLWQNGQK